MSGSALLSKAIQTQRLFLILAVDILTSWTSHAPPAKPRSIIHKPPQPIQIRQMPQPKFPTGQQILRATWESTMSAYPMRMIAHVCPNSPFFW